MFYVYSVIQALCTTISAMNKAGLISKAFSNQKFQNQGCCKRSFHHICLKQVYPACQPTGKSSTFLYFTPEPFPNKCTLWSCFQFSTSLTIQFFITENMVYRSKDQKEHTWLITKLRETTARGTNYQVSLFCLPCFQGELVPQPPGHQVSNERGAGLFRVVQGSGQNWKLPFPAVTCCRKQV